jgi:hypothetical protein
MSVTGTLIKAQRMPILDAHSPPTNSVVLGRKGPVVLGFWGGGQAGGFNRESNARPTVALGERG